MRYQDRKSCSRLARREIGRGCVSLEYVVLCAGCHYALVLVFLFNLLALGVGHNVVTMSAVRSYQWSYFFP